MSELLTSEKVKVSVIVLNWNGKRFLKDCLSSLFKQDYDSYEVLLIDNGSTDDSLDFVRHQFPLTKKLRIIALNRNYGFSKGNNIGVTYAKGDFIIILNNDTKVKPNFITQVVKIAENDEQIASVGCQILSINNRVWFSQKFTNGGFIVPFFLQGLVKARIDLISQRYCVNLANSGCACLFRKAVFESIGGYDEDFLADWEDWDLGYRINLAGYKSVHIPLPLVFHVGGGTAGHPPERYARIYGNIMFSHFKNYNISNLLTRFAVLLFFLLPLFHMGFIISVLFSGRSFKRNKVFGYLMSLPRAYVIFLSKLTVYSYKRYAIQKIRKVSDKKIFANTQRKDIL